MTDKTSHSGRCSFCKDRFCSTHVSLFTNLSEEELKEVRKIIQHNEVLKNQTLFNEGDPLDCLYIVTHGSLKITTLTKEGREQILYLLQEGDFIGDLNLFKPGYSTNSAIALENTNLCVIYKKDFDDLLVKFPNVQGKILAYAYDRIVSLEKLIDTLTTKDIETRVATLLLSLAKKQRHATNDRPRLIETPLTKEEMANFIGVTRETLSRKLNALQKQDIIQMKGNKKLIIKDYDYLYDLAPE